MAYQKAEKRTCVNPFFQVKKLYQVDKETLSGLGKNEAFMIFTSTQYQRFAGIG